MKKLDKTKAYDLRDLNDEQRKELLNYMRNNFEKWQKTNVIFDDSILVYGDDRWWQVCVEETENLEVVSGKTLFEDKKEVVKVSTQEEWDYVVDKMGFYESKKPCHQFEGYERYLRLDTFGYNHSFDYYQERGYILILLEEFKSRYKPALKIGDTFEKDGFICRVEEKIDNGKWYKIESTRKTYFTKLTEKRLKCYDRVVVAEITDKEFINQLEKHAR